MESLDKYFGILKDTHLYNKYNQIYVELHLSQCIRLPLIIHYGKRYVSWFQPGQG